MVWRCIRFSNAGSVSWIAGLVVFRVPSHMEDGTVSLQRRLVMQIRIKIKVALLAGLVLPVLGLSSCVNDLVQDVLVGVIFD